MMIVCQLLFLHQARNRLINILRFIYFNLFFFSISSLDIFSFTHYLIFYIPAINYFIFIQITTNFMMVHAQDIIKNQQRNLYQ